ncbi:EGF-like domain-containing protein [Aphelenchoides besseyi]|nr:EGF-like domain-containing protein [Aphelenchoides besseyi]KAI6201694.1 EGF-like domain-containing protein [Aphelenchoides besseyi]
MIRHWWLTPLCLAAIWIQCSQSMTVDPDRIAARLRIEAEIEEDHLKRVGRNRRQLSPKEVTIQVTAPLFTSRLFDYGPEFNDEELPRSMDVAKKVQLSRPITFYGKDYTTVYILSNGAIAFDTSLKTHPSKILPSNLKLIAPYWNRNDLQNGGHVYYREVTSGRVLERGQSEIRYQYDLNVKAISCLLVTWEKMQPKGVAALPDDNVNTFQAAIFTTSNGTFANFIYNNIGWTQAAEAGFNGGEGTEHFALHSSGTDKIMYLQEFGNTGIPGEWMFALGPKRIQRCKLGLKGDTCDEPCGADEWGADCVGCCHCANGVACHNVTGECGTIGCSDCWLGSNCQDAAPQCREDSPRKCAQNAISLTDYDRCGDPMQRCQCLDGFEGDGLRHCRDIDECENGAQCHEHATCTNTPGHYFCQCAPGYSGDGVQECVAVVSFLYPQIDGERLPNRRDAQVEWQLRRPLVVFGERRKRLIVSTNGLITVDGLTTPLQPGDHLDDMNVHGIAPFFAAVDLSRHGEVTISETTDASTLERAAQVINDNLDNRDFVANSVVIVTYTNVSAPNEKSANTFQTVLIGGRRSSEPTDLTYVQFLYKELIWSNNAEAGIMTLDKSNSIQLPGSGTQGIEQLSELSNIRIPGTWLYRVDRDVVYPCMDEALQPPYCDAQSPTLVNQRPPSPTPAPSGRFAGSSANGRDGSEEVRLPSGERVIRPDIVRPSNPVTSSSSVSEAEFTNQNNLPNLIEVPLGPEDVLDSDEASQPFTTSSAPVTVRPSRRPTPSFPTAETKRAEFPPFIVPSSPTPRTISTTHQPIFSFSSREISDLPPDAFEATFPPFVTVVPQTIKPEVSSNEATFVSQQQKPIGRIVSVEVIKPDDFQTDAASAQFTHATPQDDANETDDSNQPTIERTNVDFINPKEFPQPPVGSSEHSTEENEEHEDVVSQRMNILDTTRIISSTETSKTSTLTSSHTNSVNSTARNNQNSKNVIQPSSSTNGESNSSVFLFTTTKLPPRKVSTSSKPRLVTASATPNKHSGNGVDEDIDAGVMPFDQNRVLDAQMAGGRLAIIIPVSIVGVWLFILIVIAVVLCCQRRRTHHTLRTMYGPTYQIRPVATNFMIHNPNVMGGSKAFDGVYDDHLDKTSRTNAGDLGPYSNAGGRMSLYGSYWNLSNSGSTRGVDRLPHMS